MLVNSKFSKCKTYEKRGIITKVKVPVGKDIVDKKYDIKVVSKNKDIEIVDGKGTLVITDEIGFSGTVSYEILFAKDVFIISLKKGNLYARDKNGSIVVINAKNKISDFNGEERSIIWKTYNQLYDLCLLATRKMYNLSLKTEAMQYVNNAILKVSSYFHPNMGMLFQLKVDNFDIAPALGKFKFEKKDPIVSNNRSYIDYEEDLKGKKAKKNNKYDKYDSGAAYDKDEAYDEDVYDEESDLHEITMYGDTESEDSEDY